MNETALLEEGGLCSFGFERSRKEDQSSLFSSSSSSLASKASRSARGL